MEKPIYDLKLHERESITISDYEVMHILRVPGGWIYDIAENPNDIDNDKRKMMFVPYSEEFK